MQNNGCIKWLQVLLIVGFSIEFKHLNNKFWNILNAEVENYCFINFKLLLVGSLISDKNLILYPLELQWVKITGQINQSLRGFINLDFLLNRLKIMPGKVFVIFTQTEVLIPGAHLLQVLGNDIFHITDINFLLNLNFEILRLCFLSSCLPSGNSFLGVLLDVVQAAVPHLVVLVGILD